MVEEKYFNRNEIYEHSQGHRKTMNNFLSRSSNNQEYFESKYLNSNYNSIDRYPSLPEDQ